MTTVSLVCMMRLNELAQPAHCPLAVLTCSLCQDECLAETVTTDIACGLTHAVLASQGEEQLVDDAAAYYEESTLKRRSNRNIGVGGSLRIL